MHAKDVILFAINQSDRVLAAYLKDLSDADILIRPVDGMNNIAWQLGHLVSSERFMVESIRPNSCPALPEDFDANHGRDRTGPEHDSKLLTKNEYVAIIQAQREATKAVLNSLTDAELDAPAAEALQRICPTNHTVMLLTGTHYLMHLGQFVAVRRKLNKPVTI